MRKAICAVSVLIMSASILSASYSIVTPERNESFYSVLSSDGEVLLIDESIFYKRWNGLLAENIAEGIYKISDESSSCIIVMDGYSIEGANLRFENADSIIFLDNPKLDPEALSEIGIRNAVFARRLSELEERLYQNEGISISYIRPGDIIDIPITEQNTERIHVYCPHCGYSFYLDAL